jgi:hypothetical protein
MKAIKTASEEGGASALAYEDVWFGYRRVAEAALYDEEIPMDRKDYVRRYFEAIRPR